jgi:hypothetical protein
VVKETNLALINRALTKATGANIHDIRVLGAYYRNACEITRAAAKRWSPERIAKRLEDIEKYERLLEHFATTGEFPK